MSAGSYNLPVIEAHANWDLQIVLKDGSGNVRDLTDYHAKLTMKGTGTSIVSSFDLTTTNGRIVLGGTDGTLTLKLTGDETASIPWTQGVYDLILTSPQNYTTRILQGSVIVSAGISTPE